MGLGLKPEYSEEDDTEVFPPDGGESYGMNFGSGGEVTLIGCDMEVSIGIDVASKL